MKRLHKYQLNAVEHLVQHPKAALFMEMGLGKTATTLTAIRRLIQEKKVRKVLVIAPKRVAEHVWAEEIERWWQLRGLTTTVLKGAEKQRLSALQTSADIYLLCKESTPWFFNHRKQLFESFDTLVIDESSAFKSASSMRFKSLRKNLDNFKRVILLSGTPSPNGLRDLWSQVYLLDRGERLGESLNEYTDRYFHTTRPPGAMWAKYQILPGMAEAIANRIKDVCLSYKSSDHIDTPPVIFNDVHAELPASVMKAYKHFKKTLVLELEKKNECVTAANAAVLAGKLLQFTSGFVYSEKKEVKIIHEEKRGVVREIIEGAGDNSLLIVYNYRAECGFIDGDVGMEVPDIKESGAIPGWNLRRNRFMKLHPASGGHGLNLQEGGHTILFYGLPWSLEAYKQTVARLARQGQKRTVVVHRIIMKNTIDEVVARRLSGKEQGLNGLMDELKSN